MPVILVLILGIKKQIVGISISMFRDSNLRGQTGQSFVEMAAGLLVVIPIILLIIDCATLYMGVSLNDTVCRDAARAASMGPPNGIKDGEPKHRAETVVQRANRTTGSIRLDPNVELNEKIVGSLPSEPYGGPVNGEVSVATTVHVFPPFLISLFTGPHGVDFRTEHHFAYTWSMANTATLEQPSGSKTF